MSMVYVVPRFSFFSPSSSCRRRSLGAPCAAWTEARTKACPLVLRGVREWPESFSSTGVMGNLMGGFGSCARTPLTAAGERRARSGSMLVSIVDGSGGGGGGGC